MKIARIVLTASVGLMLSAVVVAQQARIFGVVADENGKPLSEVSIEVTSPDSSFELSLKTGKKGNYKISVIDATKHFRFRFSKPGFVSFDAELKLAVGLNERRDITLVAGQDAAAEPAPNPAIDVFNAGAEAFAQGDTLVARAKFEESVLLDPTLAAPHAAIARLELDDQQFAEAAGAAEAALALEADNQLALRVAIAAYTELGQTAKLEAAQAALAAVDPGAAAEQHYVEGARLYNAGQTAEAVGILEQAIAADPEHAKSHYLLGLCYSGLSRMAEAREQLETFLELAPNDPDAALAQEMLKYLN